jgi:ectoine utilization protein EutC
MLLLNEEELRRSVTIDLDALRRVEDAFRSLASGQAIVPPPMALDIPEKQGEVHIKSARITSPPAMVVKIAAGFYANPSLGLPTSSGLMIVMSPDTGTLDAVLLDNGYLTEVRTGLAGALAAKYAAPQRVHTVGMIGVGSQARYQLRALRLVREFERVLAWGRRPDATEAYAREMTDELGIEVVARADAESVVRESQIVVTATTAWRPVVDEQWVHSGLHITAVGADGPDKQELDAAILARADHVVCDLISQCERLGELHHALLGGLMTIEPVTELGQHVVAGRSVRTSEDELTVCDLTGVGVQDAAIAAYAFERAKELKLGAIAAA